MKSDTFYGIIFDEFLPTLAYEHKKVAQSVDQEIPIF